MRLLIAIITFGATMGMLFLVNNNGNKNELDYARILQEQEARENISPSTEIPTPLPLPKRTSAPAVVKTPVPTPDLTDSLQATSPPTLSPTPVSHIYYTSSYTTAKYYYCDTDTDWKNLSPQYLKSFSSPEELLEEYPGRILHESCK